MRKGLQVRGPKGLASKDPSLRLTYYGPGIVTPSTSLLKAYLLTGQAALSPVILRIRQLAGPAPAPDFYKAGWWSWMAPMAHRDAPWCFGAVLEKAILARPRHTSAHTGRPPSQIIVGLARDKPSFAQCAGLLHKLPHVAGIPIPPGAVAGGLPWHLAQARQFFCWH